MKRGFKYGDDCYFVSIPRFSDEPYLVKLGDGVLISNDVQFITHDGAYWILRKDEDCKYCMKFGPISIKNNVFIGARTTILPNVSIGSNVVIGACSLVICDCEENSVYAGSPARKIMALDEYKEKIVGCKLPEEVFVDYENLIFNQKLLRNHLTKKFS